MLEGDTRSSVGACHDHHDHHDHHGRLQPSSSCLSPVSGTGKPESASSEVLMNHRFAVILYPTGFPADLPLIQQAVARAKGTVVAALADSGRMGP
jgi:hypothetical protein